MKTKTLKMIARDRVRIVGYGQDRFFYLRTIGGCENIILIRIQRIRRIQQNAVRHRHRIRVTVLTDIILGIQI